MHFLITNDDSHRSPLLGATIGTLGRYGTHTIVVPKHEQSWRGKSMTRFDPLSCEEISLFGAPAYAVSGTPADCANIGIYHLSTSARSGASSSHIPPDLVVSGINAGLNAGCSFIFSSGTVGACLEGNISKIPGIAISQELDRETRIAYLRDFVIEEQVIQRLLRQGDEVLSRFLDLMKEHSQLLSRPITWNINIPFTLAPDWRFISTSLGRTRYGSCFSRSSFGFEWALEQVERDSSRSIDSAIIEQGNVSVTLLDIMSFGQMKSETSDEMNSLFAR